MKKAILATKVGMTQVYNEAGVLVPVTVLQAGPCVVTRVKTEESDGYNAVQVAYGEIRAKLVNKPDAGQLEKAGIEKEVVTRGEHKREVFKAGRFLREFRFENAASFNVKDVISLRRATRSMRRLSPRVRASRAQSRRTASTADLWHTVPSSTDTRVPTVPLRIRAACSRARECRATWAM